MPQLDIPTLMEVKNPLLHLSQVLQYSKPADVSFEHPPGPGGAAGISGGAAGVAHPIPLETREQTNLRIAVALGLVPPDALLRPAGGLLSRRSLLDVDKTALGIRERLGYGSAEAAIAELEPLLTVHAIPQGPAPAAQERTEPVDPPALSSPVQEPSIQPLDGSAGVAPNPSAHAPVVEASEKATIEPGEAGNAKK